MNSSIIRAKLWLLDVVRKLQTSSSRTRLNFFFLAVVMFITVSLLTNSDPSHRQTRATSNLNISVHKSLPKRCIVNDGKAVAHDDHYTFTTKQNKVINQFKTFFDNHKMPDIQVLEPSFYFQTTKASGVPDEKHYPAVSRAWNEEYAVKDDRGISKQNGDIWGSGGFHDEYIKLAMDASSGHPSSKIIMLPPGKYAAFSGWYFGNYGHYMHDHVSKIAWIKSNVVSDDTVFLLPYHEIHEEALTLVDEQFVKNRVIWIKYGETVSATSSSLTVTIPKSNQPFPNGTPQTAAFYTEALRRWLEESHWTPEPQSTSNQVARNERKVIFYTRRGSMQQRNLDVELEEVILSKIREAMVKRGQNPEEDLIVFNGLDENGAMLPMRTQFELFSSADTAIGPHGAGLTNVIWMDPRCGKGSREDRPKVLEFVSSERTPSIQYGTYWSYWFFYGSLPWIDYHQIYYTKDSTDAQTFIDIEIFEQTLDQMWGIE